MSMPAPSGPAAKTERLLNLVLCLLYTRRPLPKARLRDMVPQYAAATSDESFDRMFERDKDELRELGIPLVTEDLNSIWDDEPGYRIYQRDYALPEIDFAPDELAVLGLASRTWAQASLAGPAADALRKLRASGIERDEDSLVGIEPRLRTSEPAFEPVRQAVTALRTIRFDYRRSDAEVTTRTVQPWRILNRRGRWYLTGFDLDRQAERLFRLSRVIGPVTEVKGAEPYAVPQVSDDARPGAGEDQDARTASLAQLRVRAGQGHILRRQATASTEVDDYWTALQVPFTDADVFAEDLATFGADVVVIAPDELRGAVMAHLHAVLRAHEQVAS